MTTWVLVHGAFEGGWCWQRVAAVLRKQGHVVVTPTLTGCGDRHHLLSKDVDLATHIRDVTATIEYEDLQGVTLVGHSYGGTVVTGAADALADRVCGVIYLDSSAPEHGQAATGAFAEGTKATLDAMSDDDWLLPPLPLDALGVTDPRDVAWIGERRHAHPMRTLHEPPQLTQPDPPAYRRSYVVHTRRQGLSDLFGADPLAPFTDKARSLGWPMREIDAGHNAHMTHPDEVAAALLELVADDS